MSDFPVQDFKRDDAHGIVTVAGLGMSLSEHWKGSEYLPTPILVPRGAARKQPSVQAAVGGSSCMEYDILTWRKIRFPGEPRHGDLFVYPTPPATRWTRTKVNSINSLCHPRSC